MTRYAIADAKNNFSKLIEQVERGEEVEITKRGQVVAKIQPVQSLGFKVDVEDLRRRRMTMASGSDFSSADEIRKMRDEGW